MDEYEFCVFVELQLTIYRSVKIDNITRTLGTYAPVKFLILSTLATIVLNIMKWDTLLKIQIMMN